MSSSERSISLLTILNWLWKNIRNIYSISLGIFTFYFLGRYIQGNFTVQFDNPTLLLTIVGILLLLYPLWSEVQVIGIVSVKKEIEDLKTNVTEKLSVLQSCLLMSSQVQSNSSENRNSLYFGYPFGQFDPQVIQALAQNLQAANQPHQFNVPEYAKQAFEIRYALETRLRRLSQLKEIENIDDKKLSAWRIAEYVLNENERGLFRQIYNLTSRSIHGEPISADVVQNAVEPAQKLVSVLDERINELSWQIQR